MSLEHFTGAFNQTLDATAFVINPPAINGLGLAGGFEIYLQDRTGGSVKDLDTCQTPYNRSKQTPRDKECKILARY